MHSCFYNPAHGTLNLTLSLPCLPESDDQKIYLFAIELYDEDPDFSSLKPLTSTAKAAFCLLECPFEEALLYQEFVPAVLLNPVSALTSRMLLQETSMIIRNMIPKRDFYLTLCFLALPF